MSCFVFFSQQVPDLKNVAIREETDEFIAALQSLEEKEEGGPRDGVHPVRVCSFVDIRFLSAIAEKVLRASGLSMLVTCYSIFRGCNLLYKCNYVYALVHTTVVRVQ